MGKKYSLELMPANQQRRPQYACDDAWIRDFLGRVQIGHVATRWDDQPFVTPVNFWYDPEQHEIYFHTNLIGRLRANSERHDRVCFEASQYGKLLPSNVALEFSIQYESVMIFGRIRILEDEQEKRWALHELIARYFPGMLPGEHYRPATAQELKRTTVYAIAIESWSGKRNWKERADQSEEWKPLGEEWFS